MASSADSNNSVWACAICTFENPSIRKLCEMCGNRKPGPKIDEDNGWKCILCTVVNPTEAIACQMCGGPNHLKNDLTGKQLCGSCTSINLANAHSCSVCGQALNSQIIQMDDNGELTMIDMKKNKNKIKNKPANDNTINNNNLPQYANPFANNNNNNNNFQPFNNGYNNYYQPPQPQPLHQPLHSHNSMPPMPPQQYQPQQPPQPINNGGIGGMFGNMGSWFGGNSNNNNINANNVKHSHSHSYSSKKHKKKKSKQWNHNKYPQNNDNSNKEIQFKDVSEIFKNDEKDKKRIKQESEEVKILSEWYSHIYLTKKKNYDKKIISDIINKMIKLIPNEHWEEVKKILDKQKEEKTDVVNACQVCYCEFDQDEGKLIVMEKHCSHAMICKTCFKQHLKVKIKDDDITPWILCAAPDCKAPISCNLLLNHLELKPLYKFCEGFIRKHLARNNNWIRCGTKDCNYGWMILDKSTTKQHKVKCDSCHKRQTVCKDPIKQDKGFNELIKNGTLRLCPKCSLPTMKDKGMCNVMHCGKCGIYWNWRTRETGTSSSQLKNKARNNGTLWEPGELRYQQQLQQSDLPEFIKLLEKNGIKYDPNYVRGTR